MGIAFGGDAVGGPARVGDAGDRPGAGRGGFEFGDTADRAHALDAGSADDGQAGRVVAPVFEPFQAFNENGYDVLAGRCRNDAAHELSRQEIPGL